MKNLLTAVAIPGLCLGAAIALPTALSAQPQSAENADITISRPQTGGSFHGDVQSASAEVRYGDLDLQSAEGRRALRSRVELAAQDVCDRIDEPKSTSLGRPSCSDEATREAMRSVGAL